MAPGKKAAAEAEQDEEAARQAQLDADIRLVPFVMPLLVYPILVYASQSFGLCVCVCPSWLPSDGLYH